MPASIAVHFFLELAAILVACRVVGLASQRLGQPQVVGEMIAGVLLGPSLLGRIAPDIQHHLFPPGPANVVLYTAAQIGLVLYMFLIGLNFDVQPHQTSDRYGGRGLGGRHHHTAGSGSVDRRTSAGERNLLRQERHAPDGNDVSRVRRSRRPHFRCWRESSTNGDYPERHWEHWHWRVARPMMRCPGAFWRRCSRYIEAASPSPPRRSSAESCTRCCS